MKTALRGGKHTWLLRVIPEWASYRPLDLFTCGKVGQILQRWLLSEHNLEIELGRHARVSREHRFCKWCERVAGNCIVGDELHSLSACGRVTAAREVCLLKMRASLSGATLQMDATWSVMDFLHNVRGCGNKVQKRVWQALCNFLVATEERLEAEENDASVC